MIDNSVFSPDFFTLHGVLIKPYGKKMDELTKKYIEMIFYTYVIRFVCAVGIFGNIAILVVLSRRGAKETAFGTPKTVSIFKTKIRIQMFIPL